MVSFCADVMALNEAAERVRKSSTNADPLRHRRPGVGEGNTPTIFTLDDKVKNSLRLQNPPEVPLGHPERNGGS